MTLVATLNAGCTNEPTWYEASQSELIQSDYRAADELLAQVRSTLINNQPLIMATIVNIDKLDRSSTLGRLISEQVSARFTQQHYAMTEVKLRSSLYVKQDQGELMLTRELKELAATHDAQAVIVGTYAIGEQFVFVNLKIIQPISNLVMASVDYALPLDSNIRALAGRTQR
jgi:hypothetical protein